MCHWRNSGKNLPDTLGKLLRKSVEGFLNNSEENFLQTFLFLHGSFFFHNLGFLNLSTWCFVHGWNWPCVHVYKFACEVVRHWLSDEKNDPYKNNRVFFEKFLNEYLEKKVKELLNYFPEDFLIESQERVPVWKNFQEKISSNL